MLPAALEHPSGIEMVSMCTGLLGKEGRGNISVDTRLYTEYLYLYLYHTEIIVHWHYWQVIEDVAIVLCSA